MNERIVGRRVQLNDSPGQVEKTDLGLESCDYWGRTGYKNGDFCRYDPWACFFYCENCGAEVYGLWLIGEVRDSYYDLPLGQITYMDLHGDRALSRLQSEAWRLNLQMFELCRESTAIALAEANHFTRSHNYEKYCADRNKCIAHYYSLMNKQIGKCPCCGEKLSAKHGHFMYATDLGRNTKYYDEICGILCLPYENKHIDISLKKSGCNCHDFINKKLVESGYLNLEIDEDIDDEEYIERTKRSIEYLKENLSAGDFVHFLDSADEATLDIFIDDMFTYMRQERNKEFSSDAESSVNALIDNQHEQSQYITPEINDIGSIKNSTEELKRYLFHLIKMESGIMAISKRLTSLYVERFSLEQQIQHENVIHSTNAFSQIEKAIADKDNLLKKRSSQLEKSITATERELQAAEKAVFLAEERCAASSQFDYPICRKTIVLSAPTGPTAPATPTFQTSGLFNKKKVAAQNAALQTRYDAQLKKYEEDLAEYKLQYAEFEKERLRLEAEAEQEYQNARSEQEKQKAKECIDRQENLERARSAKLTVSEKLKGLHNELEAEKNKIVVELENYKAELIEQFNAGNEVVTSTAIAKGTINTEIEQAEQLLKNIVECKDRLYNCNVIFGKYRDIVAISTFYEYIMSGRCNSLEGKDGAYNLYESECRSNVVISQLSKIITSLEQIKENQYVIYTELQEIEHSLESLEKSTKQIISEIAKIGETATHMDKTLSDVKKLSAVIAESTEVSAYNSQVSAYYSKKNAELTDALGFMVALH